MLTESYLQNISLIQSLISTQQ
jgi:Transcription- and export-related complex subunit